jgi:hypothetical protein
MMREGRDTHSGEKPSRSMLAVLELGMLDARCGVALNGDELAVGCAQRKRRGNDVADVSKTMSERGV